MQEETAVQLEASAKSSSTVGDSKTKETEAAAEKQEQPDAEAVTASRCKRGCGCNKGCNRGWCTIHDAPLKNAAEEAGADVAEDAGSAEAEDAGSTAAEDAAEGADATTKDADACSSRRGQGKWHC